MGAAIYSSLTIPDSVLGFLPTVVSCEYLLAAFVPFRPSERLDARSQDLAANWIRFAEDLHYFGDVFRQRHSVGVGRLVGHTEFVCT